ncbi:ABC transporter ATP-binding protein [Kitasatospora sp. A2-31]|uniref:ABC transporter ATP-binding protein n=1 Tax=Kitasatospora sp. A2-31 TaxID=2916414 RepID=UPI001EEB6BA5|nr:ATP-binding cassette domain-containing protein [Kitasatospora sp. A2-31]MCG6495351.1 ATP-binding cassette domain-containing protein [Kitasatospora sp. A2-31]
MPRRQDGDPPLTETPPTPGGAEPRSRLAALAARLHDRDEWKFFAVLPRAHRGLAVAWWSLILVRGALPALFAVTTGLLVDAIGDGTSLTGPLCAAGTVFVLLRMLVPLHSQVGVALGERLSCLLHDLLVETTTAPGGIAHLESRELADELAGARDFDQGTVGPPMAISVGLIAGGLVEAAVGAGQVIVLAAYTWWAPLLVGGAWLATHWLLRESSFWDRNTGEVLDAQRRSDYTYKLAVDAPAAKELRIFGLGDWTVARFAAARRRLVELRWQTTKLQQRPLRWTIVVLVAANGVTLWSLARDAASGAIGTGEVVVFAQAAVGASAIAFGGLNWALPPAAGSVAAVLGLRESMAQAGRLGGTGELPAGEAPRDGIRFREVGFSYPNDDRPVLDGLDLTIEAGTSLAVVGLNGAGKTTLVKLLCGLYEPTSGTIEVDGTALGELDLASWRRRLTAVFQDFNRYELPLRDNVAPLGAPDEVIEAALADAGAAGLADLDTVLAPGYDGGRDLSGGQWQRVAVARALCAVRQGAGVVVLDEPTAQLDVRGEAEIFDRILTATKGCTTVLISHRFSTVQHADRICVLADGRVAELGTHDELMAANGRYRQMFDLQASRFEEEPDGIAG